MTAMTLQFWAAISKTMRHPRILLAATICAMLVGCGSREKTVPPIDPRNPVDLNKTLTNEMSEFEGIEKMDKDISNFMKQWGLHGMSVSVIRNDSLVFSRGYGWADEEKNVEMTPGTILRVASVSKLITAAGIMKLCEQGKVSFSDKVFGEEGILSEYTDKIKDKRYFKISVEDLLRHEGGFSTRGGDPMFTTRDIILRNRLAAAPTNSELVALMVQRSLKFYPGTSQEYSNFGYLLLSMIIEKVTGEPYEKWMQANVLQPAACRDMHIAYNNYSERYLNETRYYVPSNEPLIQEYNNSGREVIRCYGGNDIRNLSGAGAWVTSTPELARFVASIDGKDGVPDVLSKESVDTMTYYYDDSTYSIGWNDTKPENGWLRTGTLSGTSALIKYYQDGECWVLVTNTSTWKGPKFSRYTRGLCNKCKEKYSDKFPKHDLFYKL